MMKNITRLRLCIEECAYISVVMQITSRRPGELEAQLTGASDRLVASLGAAVYNSCNTTSLPAFV